MQEYTPQNRNARRQTNIYEDGLYYQERDKLTLREAKVVSRRAVLTGLGGLAVGLLGGMFAEHFLDGRSTANMAPAAQHPSTASRTTPNHAPTAAELASERTAVVRQYLTERTKNLLRRSGTVTELVSDNGNGTKSYRTTLPVKNGDETQIIQTIYDATSTGEYQSGSNSFFKSTDTVSTAEGPIIENQLTFQHYDAPDEAHTDGWFIEQSGRRVGNDPLEIDTANTPMSPAELQTKLNQIGMLYIDPALG